MILPLLLIAGIGGLLFLEKKKKAVPALPPPGCVPATALVPGHRYLFAILPQPGTLPLDDERAQGLATAFVQTGRWRETVAWVRGDARAPAFSWPSDAAQNAALVRGIYSGPQAAVPASMNYAIDCGVAAPSSAQAGQLFLPPILLPPGSGPFPPPSPPAAVNAGYIYEDHLAGGWAPPGAPRCIGGPPGTRAMPAMHMTGADPRAISPEQLPDLVMRICAVILAQAMSAQAPGAPGALPVPDGGPAVPVPGVPEHVAGTVAVPAPGPAPAPAPAAVAVAAVQTGGVGGGSPALGRGRNYFVAWPSGGGPLRRDFWEMGRVTDSAMSPNHFAADPNKEPIPLKAVPASAPQPWLSSYGRGKAIAVLMWIGPEGGSDPTVEVLGEYAPRRPGEQAAA